MDAELARTITNFSNYRHGIFPDGHDRGLCCPCCGNYQTAYVVLEHISTWICMYCEMAFDPEDDIAVEEVTP